MIMGNLEGLVNGTEQMVFDHEVTGSAVSSISTGNILNGDEDGWYTIICREIGDSGTSYGRLQLNGDTGNTHGYRSIVATNTSVADLSGSGEPINYLSVGALNAGYSNLSVHRIYAKSGAVRLINSTCAETINGTSVGSVWTAGQVWSNTADDITNITFTRGAGTSFGVGTRIIILKSNNFTNGTHCGTITTPKIAGAWVRVGSQILSSPASSVTFSGLDGDTAVCYYLSAQAKITDGNYGVMLMNNDSGATNYGVQNLTGTNTTVSAYRGVEGGINVLLGATNKLTMTNGLIFAKQGFVRPSIWNSILNISGTTVEYIRTSGFSYSVTNTNITSLVLNGAFDTGSQFDLYALYV